MADSKNKQLTNKQVISFTSLKKCSYNQTLFIVIFIILKHFNSQTVRTMFTFDGAWNLPLILFFITFSVTVVDIFSLNFTHGCIEILHTIQRKIFLTLPQQFTDSPPICETYVHLHSIAAELYTRNSADLYILYYSEHRTSLNICSTINIPTFKMEEGSCAARSHWILIKLLCQGYVFATDHTACYHDNKQKFPFIYYTQVLFNTETILPSPLPRSYNPFLCSQHPLGVWGIHFTSIDLLQMSGAKLITWLIQMSVRSLPHFFYLFKCYQIESELLCQWMNCTIWNRMNWVAIYKHVREVRCSAVTQLSVRFELSYITVWGSHVGTFWPAVERGMRW